MILKFVQAQKQKQLVSYENFYNKNLDYIRFLCINNYILNIMLC